MKKIVLIGATAIALLSLSACTNTTKNNATGKTKAPSQTTAQTNQPFAFYKDAKTNSRIYYKIATSSVPLGKDSIIDAIIYVNHGKYTYYGTNSNLIKLDKKLTLGDLKNKSDSQVLSLAKEQNKVMNESLAADLKQVAEQVIESPSFAMLTEDTQPNIKLSEAYKYVAPTAQPLEVEVTSDASGNNLGTEAILLPEVGSQVKFQFYSKGSAHGYYVGLENTTTPDYIKSYSISAGIHVVTADVYEKTYSVSNLAVNGEATDYLLTLTKKGSNSFMKLDSLNEKGLKQVNEISSEKLRTW